MGKGDQRTRRGKIWRGTFGKRRPKKSKPNAKTEGQTAPAVKEPEKTESE